MGNEIGNEENMKTSIIIYLIVMNLITFVVFGDDKYKAMKKKFRVPEKTLFLLAAVGGSIGALAGMFTFRHKTRKWYFRIGIPCILAAQVFLLKYLI